MLTTYGKRRSGKACETMTDPKAPRRLRFPSVLNFNSPSLDFPLILASSLWHISVAQFGFSDVPFQNGSLELELKGVAKSFNQRPGFINNTSTYFISLFNNIFLCYGCSAEEAEQQHVGLLLILHTTITY